MKKQIFETVVEKVMLFLSSDISSSQSNAAHLSIILHFSHQAKVSQY